MHALSVPAALVLLTVALPSQNAVLQWNDAALAAIRAANTPPPAASRQLAMLHAAIFDAANGVRPRFEAYLVQPDAPNSANRWKRDYMRIAQETWRTRHAMERTGECGREPCTRAMGQLRVVDTDTMRDSDGQPVAGGNMSSLPHFTVRVFEFRPLAGRRDGRDRQDEQRCGNSSA